MCEDDVTCIENGYACFRGLKTVYLKDKEKNPNLKTEMREKANACLNDNDLMTQFQEYSKFLLIFLKKHSILTSFFQFTCCSLRIRILNLWWFYLANITCLFFEKMSYFNAPKLAWVNFLFKVS